MEVEKTGGIYKIQNNVNGKVYIGKAKNFKSRWSKHKGELNKEIRSKDCNRYLFNSVKKHGFHNFSFHILEVISIDSDKGFYSERELFWMDEYNSCDRNFGYNLRRDSSSQTFVHEDTIALQREIMKGEGNPNYGNRWSEEQKQYMSELKKEGFRNGTLTVNLENTYKAIEVRNKRWEENPELKEEMKRKVSEIHNVYEYLKIDKETGEIIEVFQNKLEIKNKYPQIGKTVVLSVCNGFKKSYMGFIWRYRDRGSGEIVEPTPRWNKKLREELKNSY